jgi:hypothetical protein
MGYKSSVFIAFAFLVAPSIAHAKELMCTFIIHRVSISKTLL